MLAITSSAHEKSIIPTWEKSITVSDRSRESASSASICVRTAAPVGRDLLAIPVVDQQHRLLGIVTVDDVIDALVKEETEDVQKLVEFIQGVE